MLVEFSPAYTQRLLPGDLAETVYDAAREAKAKALVKWERWPQGQWPSIRFTMPAADDAAHEAVILRLLTIDNQAKLRTTRATYDGLADYNAKHQ